jgi:hypothetical protein
VGKLPLLFLACVVLGFACQVIFRRLCSWFGVAIGRDEMAGARLGQAAAITTCALAGLACGIALAEFLGLGAPWLLRLYWAGLGCIAGMFLLRHGPKSGGRETWITPANQFRAMFNDITGWDFDAAVGAVFVALVLGGLGAALGAVAVQFDEEPRAERIIAGAVLGALAGALAGHQAFHLSRPFRAGFGMLAGTALGFGAGVLMMWVHETVGSVVTGALCGLAGGAVTGWVMWRPPDEVEWIAVLSQAFRPMSPPPPPPSGPPRTDPAAPRQSS